MLSLRRSDSIESSNGSGGACTDGVSNHANSFGRDCVAWVQSRLCCCLKRSDPDTNTAIERRSLRQPEADAKPHFSPAARAAPDDIEEKTGGFELLEGVWGVGKDYRDDEDALWKCFGLRKGKGLGEGNFGAVYKYIDNENTSYAVKIHRQLEGETTLAYHEGDGNCYDDFKENRGELIGLALPSHPNVAKVHACIMQDINSGKYIPIHSMDDISEDDYLSVQLKVIISEFVDGVELHDLLCKQKSFEQTPAGGVSLAKELALQFSEVLEFLHTGSNVIYRDLKSENIIVTHPGTALCTFKLVDFGCSKRLRGCDGTESYTGSPFSIAPEIDDDSLYSYQVDLWSFGILIWEAAAAGSGVTTDQMDQMICREFVKMYPNQRKVKVDTDSSGAKIFSLRNWYCLSGLLKEMGKDVIGQLFDDSIPCEKKHSDAPLLKKMVTGLLEPNPDERMSLEEVRTLLIEPASLS